MMPSRDGIPIRQESLYSSGLCHVFAIALHRRFGWPFLVVLDREERFWEDPDDPDNWLPAVVHVYAVDPEGQAWDVLGARPAQEAQADARSRWRIGEYDSEEIGTETGLMAYVEDEAAGDEVERPLAAFGEADVKEAMAEAEAMLSGVPGFAEATGSAPRL